VLRAGAAAFAGRYVADPGLAATVSVVRLGPDGAPAVNASTLTWAGNWSWTAGVYALPFKLAAPVGGGVNGSESLFAVTLTLAHPLGASVSVV
jgi:hypothetical protein